MAYGAQITAKEMGVFLFAFWSGHHRGCKGRTEAVEKWWQDSEHLPFCAWFNALLLLWSKLCINPFTSVDISPWSATDSGLDSVGNFWMCRLLPVGAKMIPCCLRALSKNQLWRQAQAGVHRSHPHFIPWGLCPGNCFYFPVSLLHFLHTQGMCMCYVLSWSVQA